MKVGHIVKSINPGKPLRSGGELYDLAVVVCLEPFTLVSMHGDMRWSSTVKPENFQKVGAALPERFNELVRRLAPEHQIRMPQGESLLSNQLGNGLTLLMLGLRSMAVDLQATYKSKVYGDRPNDSYGWFFEYQPEAGHWKAYRQCYDHELVTIRRQFQAGRVFSVKANGPVYKSSEAFDREHAEGQSLQPPIQGQMVYVNGSGGGSAQGQPVVQAAGGGAGAGQEVVGIAATGGGQTHKNFPSGVGITE